MMNATYIMIKKKIKKTCSCGYTICPTCFKELKECPLCRKEIRIVKSFIKYYLKKKYLKVFKDLFLLYYYE